MDFDKEFDNQFNRFMAVYFKLGYSYEKAHEKAMDSMRDVLGQDAQIPSKEKEAEDKEDGYRSEFYSKVGIENKKGGELS